MRSTQMAALCLVFSLFFPAFSQIAAAQDVRREVEILQDSDYFGFDLRAEKNVSLDECQAICVADPACRAFTYNSKVQWCFLKSDFDKIGSFPGAIAGKIIEVSNEPDIGAAPKLDFVPEGTLDEATRFRARALSGKGESIGSGDELMNIARAALAANRTDETARAISQAIKAEPENADLQLQMSRLAAGWLAANSSYDYRMQETATATAISAYGLTRTASKRAEALAVLARALEQRSLFRPALEAYKRSLELQNSPQVATAFADLKARKGFRITGNTVDADTPSPRICVQFSEDLVKNGVDYASYVTVDGKSSGAIEASGQQICAEGLEHGNTYRITLRAGLPSSVGENLEQPVVINSYIRDRAPAVRFTGENFVLPGSARKGIPIIGINADKADLELFRIGDRSLARLISGSQFLSQLEGYSVEQISDDMGSSVWKGSIELGREINKEVVTSFPVDEALPNREPGIYVLTAKAAGSEQDSWEPVATQWFLISDIGLTTYAGTDGLSVFARSLDSAGVLSNVEVTLLARNNEVLGKAITDNEGRAVLSPGLMRGSAGQAPAVLTASIMVDGKQDFVFLDMTKAGFDLSDRGVSGRETPGPLDLYTYLDRGIFRPGETVNMVSLVRDDSVAAAGDLPLTIILRRPDGVEAERVVSTAPQLGAHAASFALQDNAMLGVWRIAIHSDPDAAPLSEKTFLVEDFVPDRTEFDLSSQSIVISPVEPAMIKVDGRYLYGAPAANLALEGEIRLKTLRERSEAPGFEFGLADEDAEGNDVIELAGLGRTDGDGKAEIEAAVSSLPATTRPLVADVVIRMKEDGGRAIERTLTLPVAPDGAMIGVKPEFEDHVVGENSNASFQVIALDSNGKRIDLKGLKWSLNEIVRNYQWYRDGSYWRYEPVEVTRNIDGGSLDAKADEVVRVSAKPGWGRYRLDVESPDAEGPATSVLFDAGWYVEAATTETPDALEIALDKETYSAGETAKLKVSPRFAGEMLVAIGADRLYRTLNVNVPEGGAEIDIPVDENWGAGAYVTATLFRPGSQQDSRMPARAIGTTWLKLDPESRALQVALDLPEKVRPDTILNIPVSVASAAGEEAYVTVAAVDVGILNLTRFSPPDPGGWYFGQRKLGLEIRDIYGRLIDSSQGAFGKLRTGGDGPGESSQGSPPTEKLLAFYSGIVRLDENGKAEIAFELPQFNGTARVMAVAWTKKAVGHANGDVIIRDPVVLSASLPRVLAPGDQARTIIEIHNTDGPAGNYQLSMSGTDLVTVGSVQPEITLGVGERKVLDLPLAANRSGTGEMTFAVTLDGEKMSDVTRVVKVRPATLPVSNRMEIPLAANGGTIRLDGELLAQSIVEGASVSINISRRAGFDVPALLTRLDRYPYGCAEQTTSRALPLLYLSEFETPASLVEGDDIAKRVNAAIDRVLTYQASGGSFGLWGPGDGDLWLDSYVTDFLTRAVEKGYNVPEQAMKLAVQNLQNTLAYTNDLAENGNDIAYALYVLARNRRASVSDLRYYADERINDFATPLARAHLAGALALYNEIERANRTFSSALSLAKDPASINLARSDYGSSLRDGAAMLVLASETRPVAPQVADMMELVASEIDKRSYTSTQEDAWLLLAARAAQEGNKAIRLDVNGSPLSGAYTSRLQGSDLVSNPLSVSNRTSDPLTAVVTTLASPRDPLPAGGNGFEIKRTFYNPDGTEADMNAVRQNQRFVVVLEINELNGWPSRILVSDLLPGGFEIDNPRLVKSAELEGFEWLGEVETAHSEFRDDRFVSAFNRSSGDDRSFAIAYVVRAVTPGTYTLPAASVEDMYRPQFSARTATGFLQIGKAE
ncbi:MAG: alpha-2-macroglobulin family protein [Nitratireductor sp.]|nr:alpha-2-macroglobulin family protein [Nitratireductor sp.]